MGFLPVPAKTYFADSAFELVEYQIKRDDTVITTAKGLKNSEKGREYVSFLYGTDVRIGDTLCSEDESLNVIETFSDTYNGEKQLINAVYR